MTKEKEYIIVNRDKEFRCSNPECGKKIKKRPRMFMFGELGSGGKIEVKCPRCKTLCRYHKI